MCGIIGYTGTRQAAPIIMEGLSSLEYRGYDSAGIAVLDLQGRPAVHKKSGKLTILQDYLRDQVPQGLTGIGHTRWATHGAATDLNSHPHTDCENQVVVVHNGIVENYVEIRQELTEAGHQFNSQTDTECIPHLIESFLERDLSIDEAVISTARRLRGSNAVVAYSTHNPNRLVAFRLGNAGGLVVGYGKDEMLVSSDLPALLPHTHDVVYLEDGEVVSMDRESASYRRINGVTVTKSVSHVPYDPQSAAKGKFKHFMLKELCCSLHCVNGT